MTMIAAAAAAADDDDASTDLAFATPKEARDGHRRPDEDQGADDRCDEAAGGEAGEVALGIAAVAFESDIGGGGGGGGHGLVSQAQSLYYLSTVEEETQSSPRHWVGVDG